MLYIENYLKVCFQLVNFTQIYIKALFEIFFEDFMDNLEDI